MGKFFRQFYTLFLIQFFLLGTVSVVLVYGIFGQELRGLLQNLETVQKGNTGIELSDGFITFSNLTPTYVFLFLHFYNEAKYG